MASTPTSSRSQVAAIDGWFTMPDDGSEPKLLGMRCDLCGTYVFPPRSGECPNPVCDSAALTVVELSSRGTVWSYTVNHYAPPAPYVAADPFLPIGLVAVQLADEGMIVLGQLAAGIDPATLTLGTPVTLDLGVLYSDADHDYLTYTWTPDTRTPDTRTRA